MIQFQILRTLSTIQILPLFLPPSFVRLLVRNGNSSQAPVLFDSDLDDVPERGLVSEGSTLYLELTTDSSSTPLLLALRYEGERPPPASVSSGT